MSVSKAKSHYQGKDGHRKLNCAQAIMAAFKDRFGRDDEAILQCLAYGGGRAPEGQCGSLFAAKILLGENHPAIAQCESALKANAGSLKCREIRSGGKLSCVGCVETVAACLEQA